MIPGNKTAEQIGAIYLVELTMIPGNKKNICLEVIHDMKIKNLKP